MAKNRRATKIPKWKYWLSYLTEVHIESSPSELNPHLYVSLVRGRLQLCTGNAIYSFEDLYDNFSKTFDRFRKDYVPGKEVLILGFGLGSVPIILEQKYGPNFRFTGVDADESVVDLANRYALDKIKSPIEISVAPAEYFAGMTTQKFDLIAMDVFLDDKIPENLQTEEYLETLKSLLKPGGLLLYNRLALSQQDLEETEKFFDDVFLKTFPEGTAVDVDGNWMLSCRLDVFQKKADR